MSGKKWTKKVSKDKVVNPTSFDKEAAYNEAIAAIEKMKIITISIMVDRLHVSGSLAKKLIAEQLAAGKIEPVNCNSAVRIYKKVEAQ